MPVYLMFTWCRLTFVHWEWKTGQTRNETWGVEGHPDILSECTFWTIFEITNVLICASLGTNLLLLFYDFKHFNSYLLVLRSLTQRATQLLRSWSDLLVWQYTHGTCNKISFDTLSKHHLIDDLVILGCYVWLDDLNKIKITIHKGSCQIKNSKCQGSSPLYIGEQVCTKVLWIVVILIPFQQGLQRSQRGASSTGAELTQLFSLDQHKEKVQTWLISLHYLHHSP